MFRQRENESPGIRMESNSPTALRLGLVEQNQGFEDLPGGAALSAAWALGPARYPLPPPLLWPPDFPPAHTLR